MGKDPWMIILKSKESRVINSNARKQSDTLSKVKMVFRFNRKLCCMYTHSFKTDPINCDPV